MSTFNAKMFESIKDAVDASKAKQGSGAQYKNLLSISTPGLYLVRLLPNMADLKNTFLHYFHHGWPSIETGQYGSVVSPSTWGERCPVSELYFKIIRNTESTEKEVARAKELLKRKENWVVNVYVINDPINPDNNGTVKVLRYGRQIDKIIQSALSGDDAAEFGPKIFDLSENGCNLRIKTELVSDQPGAPKFSSYTQSRFMSPCAIEGMAPANIDETYAAIHDLQSFAEHKTVDEIKAFIAQHYFGEAAVATPTGAAATAEKITAAAAAEDNSADEEDVPYDHPPVSEKKTEAKAEVKAPATGEMVAADDKIKNLLAGLENL